MITAEGAQPAGRAPRAVMAGPRRPRYYLGCAACRRLPGSQRRTHHGVTVGAGSEAVQDAIGSILAKLTVAVTPSLGAKRRPASRAGYGSAGSNTSAVSGLPNICLVLITPDSSEIRWVSEVPKPGVRIPGRFPGAWLVVDEVLQSGVMTHTVFGSTAPEGLIDQARDLAADAVERVQESLSPTTMRPSLGRSGQVHHLSKS